jgi:hypothetical protein
VISDAAGSGVGLALGRDSAIRQSSATGGTQYFDVATGGATHGTFRFRGSSGFTTYAVLDSTGLAVTGTLSATGAITQTGGGGAPIAITGATTGATLNSIANSGGTSYWGLESSAGGTFTGTTAYSFILGSGSNRSTQIIANATKVADFSSTGLAITGTVTATVSSVSTIALKAIEGSNTGGFQFRLGNNDSTYNYDIGRSVSTGYLQFYGNQTGAVGYTFGGINDEYMRINSSGDLGLGTSSPSAKLDVNGSARFRDATGANQAYWVTNKGVGSTNSGAFGLGFNAVNYTPASLPSALLWDGNNGYFTINTSSRKYKRNIVSVTDEQLDKAMLLKPSYYQRKEQEYFEYGFIAEEVNEIGLDEFVTKVDGEISGLAYDKMVTLAIGLAQRQAIELQSLRKRLAALESK